MSKFNEILNQLKEFEGKTIESVKPWETYDEKDVHSLLITFTDGSSIDISPTSFNYGGQNLVFDIKNT